MATAKTHAVCAFGARIQLDPRSTLGEIDAELQDLQDLILRMASGDVGDYAALELLASS